MEIQNLIMKVPDDYNLFLYSDDHEGSLMRYAKGWEILCHMINSEWNGIKPENNKALDHGDITEGILIDDKRYNPLVAKHVNAGLQREQAIKNRRPIQSHLVTILEGNHPWKLWKYEYITPMVCKELGLPYGTWACKVNWTDYHGRLMFKSYHTHGRKGITSTADDPKRRMANRELILKRHLKEKAGDTVLMCKGHTHQLIITRPEPFMYLTDDRENINAGYTKVDHTAEFIHPDLRWYVNTGSFYRLYNTGVRVNLGTDEEPYEVGVSSYAEVAEYDPVELGFAIAEIRNRQISEIRKIKLSAGRAGRMVDIDVDPPL